MRQRILLVLATGLTLLVPAVAANASSSQFTTVEAPRELTRGSPGAALDEIESLGADGIRIQLGWREVAPSPDSRTKPSFNATDPAAYSGWENYDAAIDGARERGLLVQVTITGGAPRWATAGGRDAEGLTRPSATEFGKFATAVGRRYGSKVQLWSVWNEPNLGKLLKPIYQGNRLASPLIYRDLYLRAYAGLKTAGVTKPILVGELAPQRNSSRTFGTVAPIDFVRGMLCLDKSYKKVKVNGKTCSKLPAQGFAMHPYSTQAGPFLRPSDQGNVVIGVLSRLTTALDKAAAAGAITGRLPLYLTEFGVQSAPDKLVGVPLDKQSDFRSIAERIAYLNPRVKSFSQYLLTDDDNPTGRAYGAFESGLYLNRGHKAKPSLHSFRLPLVVVPARGSTTRATLWGLVRPAKSSGSVTIEYKDRGAWRRLGSSRFSGSGYWTKPVSTNASRSWRVKWTSPEGTTYTGPATRARTKP
ncbi:glycoside hydrolase family 1 protein [Conexibacter woesei]|uniref:Glycoside hydrolase family 5 domain-containing protein n=1 Tax=Conexibacter woesei (strain DSM 14684 / CCUG 47730 / CIP 108061 / JCM 11494 / NBRC 100937 / ID131577) TaxID=469383 RepID=D3EZ72_CONWI|nr:hypothetical protein [Conexibacter woesei]ADB51837.1 hypothetical protein Cwoe_3419 [Conexibacter woesei DSM 14684]